MTSPINLPYRQNKSITTLKFSFFKVKDELVGRTFRSMILIQIDNIAIKRDSCFFLDKSFWVGPDKGEEKPFHRSTLFKTHSGSGELSCGESILISGMH